VVERGRLVRGLDTYIVYCVLGGRRKIRRIVKVGRGKNRRRKEGERKREGGSGERYDGEE
jgi:hypothetical protein